MSCGGNCCRANVRSHQWRVGCVGLAGGKRAAGGARVWVEEEGGIAPVPVKGAKE